ncbi:DUF4192 family protein [Glycomyces sp. NPDC047010]|uniref:DUF4192 family protein n=1 Tax=Glycomyces sp. NPDC047010 TaxID=3155023 RepID=UPI0033C06BC1
MNLPRYASLAQWASLDGGTIAALAPYLIGRPPVEELVVVAGNRSGPAHMSVRPLAVLDDTEGCEQLIGELAAVAPTWAWLVGFAADLTDVAAAIAGLLDGLAALDIDSAHRLIAATADGTRWGIAADHVDEVDEVELTAVASLDSGLARLAALAARARCAQRAEATAMSLRNRTEAEADSIAAAEHVITKFRDLATYGSLREADRVQLRGALAATDAISAAEATSLGLALAADADLMAEAIDRIWHAPDQEQARLGLWCRIAAHTTGEARAAAATLAALAAWRTGDPLAQTACEIARACDPKGPLAYTLAQALACGIPASYLAPVSGTQEQASPTAASIGAINAAEGEGEALNAKLHVIVEHAGEATLFGLVRDGEVVNLAVLEELTESVVKSHRATGEIEAALGSAAEDLRNGHLQTPASDLVGIAYCDNADAWGGRGRLCAAVTADGVVHRVATIGGPARGRWYARDDEDDDAWTRGLAAVLDALAGPSVHEGGDQR